MSSSAEEKSVKDKRSRGPLVGSRQLKELKQQERTDQQDRTKARVAVYKQFGPEPSVDLYQVGRSQVLHVSTEATPAEPFVESRPASIDLSEPAGH